MKVAFYGRLADLIGRDIDLEAATGCSIGEMRQMLAAEHPGAASVLTSRRALACVGGSLVRDEHVVGPGDLVEFLPPVSGG